MKRRTAEEMIQAALDRRMKTCGKVTVVGLPGRDEPFVCYPKDAKQRDRWIAGWKRKYPNAEITIEWQP